MGQFMSDCLISQFAYFKPNDQPRNDSLTVDHSGAAQMFARTTDGNGCTCQFWKQLQRSLDHLVGTAGEPLFHQGSESDGHDEAQFRQAALNEDPRVS